MMLEALKENNNNPLYWTTTSDIKFHCEEYGESVIAQENAVLRCKLPHRQ